MFAVGVVCLVLLAEPCVGKWSNGPASFNCKMRKLAYEYGQKALPRYGKFESLYYALGLNDDCTDVVPPPKFTDEDRRPAPPVYAAGEGNVLFVDYNKGSDGNSGSITAPLKTVAKAVAKAAELKGATTINLRAGTHFLDATVHFSPANSGLTIQNYNGEEAVVSGGRQLPDLEWKPYKVDNVSNMYVADVSKAGLTKVPGLQMNGVRATRARYPNGNVELPERTAEAGDPNGVAMISGGKGKWTPPDLSKQGKQQYVTVTDPAKMRNYTNFGFSEYMVGIGGPCEIYEPPVAYWCAEHPSGGGAFAFRVPRGVTPDSSVVAGKGAAPDAGLHMPYEHPEDAIVNVWRPARWANWMFEVAQYDAKTGNLTFGKGGFQGARGNNNGGDWFIENVFEEFDYPNEFFWDKRTQQLYFFYNATGAPPKNAEFVVPQVQTLFNLTASRWNPIRDVTIRGLTFTAAAYTYMEPHGVPSGGDWALDRMGAVFLQGTEKVTVDSCHFTRIDGNGVFVSGYNRNATISNSEFSWIGGNSMAGWGFTNETGANPNEGIDGTDGNHPRYTTIVNNLAREIGHYEKQSSFWFQAKVALSVLRGNVFFNGPRAGINFNDGFGGGDELSGNLVFSTCRESGDHGPFNSWDRQPFITDVYNGTPSVHMAWREIHHNFFIDNYNPQEGVDNDDGSCFYRTHDNFFVAGNQGMKNDFGGHDNYHYNNVYAYVGKGFGICAQLEGHEDAFFNNTLVMTGSEVGSGEGCSGPGKTIVHDLKVFTKDGKATECGKSPPESPGTTVGKFPSDDELVAWGRSKLPL